MICSANQLTGFYMMATLAFNELMPGTTRGLADIKNNCIESEEVHELRITIVSKLIFENYNDKLCKKASQTLNAFARISYYLALNKKKLW